MRYVFWSGGIEYNWSRGLHNFRGCSVSNAGAPLMRNCWTSAVSIQSFDDCRLMYSIHPVGVFPEIVSSGHRKFMGHVALHLLFVMSLLLHMHKLRVSHMPPDPYGASVLEP